MLMTHPSILLVVNCRIGSLERHTHRVDADINVNCRIGSLEMDEVKETILNVVNCRVGSLETMNYWSQLNACC